MTTTSERTVIEFDVTQDHIDNGVRANCRCCPIALALKPYFPEGTRVNVFCGSVEAEQRVAGNLEATTWWVADDSADQWRNFIYDFDDSRPVKPCRLAIQIAAASQSL